MRNNPAQPPDRGDTAAVAAAEIRPREGWPAAPGDRAPSL